MSFRNVETSYAVRRFRRFTSYFKLHKKRLEMQFYGNNSTCDSKRSLSQVSNISRNLDQYREGEIDSSSIFQEEGKKPQNAQQADRPSRDSNQI
jgi:hypothetical protein